MQAILSGPSDPGCQLTNGTAYSLVVTLDLSSTTQHTYSYTVYNFATNAVVYASGMLLTRNPTAVPDRLVMDWGVIAESSTSPNPFIELGAVGISAGNSSAIFGNNFSTSAVQAYTNGQAINLGQLASNSWMWPPTRAWAPPSSIQV